MLQIKRLPKHYWSIQIQISKFLQLCTNEAQVKPCLAFSFGPNSSHTFLSCISDKTTVTMGNLQANLFFLHDLGDPWDLGSPREIASERMWGNAWKPYTIVFDKQSLFLKASLTVSPLWPASPGGPTGPGVPGPPGEPGKPAGPGSPRSPCKAEFQKFYLKRIGLSNEDWSRPKQQNCSTASLLLSNCNLQRYSCCKNLSLSL